MGRCLAIALAIATSQAAALFDIDSNPNVAGICYSLWHSMGYDNGASELHE